MGIMVGSWSCDGKGPPLRPNVGGAWPASTPILALKSAKWAPPESCGRLGCSNMDHSMSRRPELVLVSMESISSVREVRHVGTSSRCGAAAATWRCVVPRRAACSRSRVLAPLRPVPAHIDVTRRHHPGRRRLVVIGKTERDVVLVQQLEHFVLVNVDAFQTNWKSCGVWSRQLRTAASEACGRTSR